MLLVLGVDVCKIHCVQYTRSILLRAKYTVCSLLIQESVFKLCCVQFIE